MRHGLISIEREGRAAVVRVHGELAIPTAKKAYHRLRNIGRRRDIDRVILDLADAERIDSSGVAVVSLVTRQLEKHGKKLELRKLDERMRAAFELTPKSSGQPRETEDAPPGALERLGARCVTTGSAAVALYRLVVGTVRQGIAVATRRKKLPQGALAHQIVTMGVDAVFIVGLLAFLLGMTMAFQGAVQLQRFGADVFVADMIGLSIVRELAPLITAIILTGRTGAAIAAELGTMKVRSELDALQAMGIDPHRFLIVPRMAAITFVGPALTVMSIFLGILGGMLVASFAIQLSFITFWSRLTERLTVGDFAHGIGKSLVFAWIIGFAGSHFGLRAGKDASAVGTATTRTVVVSIFFIIMVDAVFATISTLTRYS